MRRLAIAAFLSLAGFSLVGCKSQEQKQQEDLASLQAKYNAMMNQYISDCSGLGLDRSNAPRGRQMQFRGGPNKANRSANEGPERQGSRAIKTFQ